MKRGYQAQVEMKEGSCMSNQEIKDRINYFYLQIDGTYDFPNSKEGDLLKMVHKALTEQATLIHQLEERNRHLQGMFNSQNGLGQRYYEEKEHANSSLELAIKALEEVRSLNYNGVEPQDDIEFVAKSVLDQIRRIET